MSILRKTTNKISQLVYCRLAADLDTPVSLMLKLTNGEENSFILESVTGGEIEGDTPLSVCAPIEFGNVLEMRVI